MSAGGDQDDPKKPVILEQGVQSPVLNCVHGRQIENHDQVCGVANKIYFASSFHHIHRRHSKFSTANSRFLLGSHDRLPVEILIRLMAKAKYSHI